MKYSFVGLFSISENNIFAKTFCSNNDNIDKDMKKQNIAELPREDFYKCECDNIIDLKAVKNEIAMVERN